MDFKGHLGLQNLLGESPTEIAPLWQWVIQEPSSPPQMEPHGLQGHLRTSNHLYGVTYSE